MSAAVSSSNLVEEPQQAVLTEPCQPELFCLPAGVELLLPEEVQQHKFTAEIVAKNKAKYAAIVSGLAEGLGVRQMARAFGVSHHTVQKIREREPKLVAALKEGFGKRLMNCAGLAVERLEEGLEKGTITDGQLPVTVGILTDKVLAWSGQSAPRAEIRLEVTVERVKGIFAELALMAGPEPGPMIDVEPLEIAGGSAPDSKSSEPEEKAQ